MSKSLDSERRFDKSQIRYKKSDIKRSTTQFKVVYVCSNDDQVCVGKQSHKCNYQQG